MKKSVTFLIICAFIILSVGIRAQGLISIDSTSSGNIIFGPKWFHDSIGFYALKGGTSTSQLLTTDSLGRVVLVTTTGVCAYACDTNNTMATIYYTDSLVAADIGGGSNWQLTGNSGTIPGTNFIGTTDNQDLVFKVGDILSGLLDNSIGNTAFGVYAFKNNISGGNNVATGMYALYNNTIGFGNTALGEEALNENTSGSYNTVIGNNSFSSNITGTELTGIGMNNNVITDGLSNSTVIGYNALVGQSNSTSIGDTTQPLFVGVGTAYPAASLDVRVTAASGPVSCGLFNGGKVGIGTFAPEATLQIGDSILGNATFKYIDGNQGTGKVLTSDANGNATWQAGGSAWSLTSDTLTFKVNNIVTGVLDNSLKNYALGQLALTSVTTGAYNEAVGYNALAANTSGRYNLAIGDNALATNSASNNVAIGTSALSNNTSGYLNVAIGQLSLVSNTTGTANVAIGGMIGNVNTGEYNSTTPGGYDNPYATLRFNTTGTANTAVGSSGLSFNITGSSNTAIGAMTLINNTTGNNNTAIGEQALSTNITGSYNTALGGSALGSSSGFNVTGVLLTAIGYGADILTDSLLNATAIGANALVGQSNSVSIGDTTQPLLVGIGTGYPLASLDVRVTGSSGSIPSGLFNGGSVGIGTYAPTATLDVRGQTNAALFVTKTVPVTINCTTAITAAQVASGYIVSTSVLPATVTLPGAAALATYLNATQGASFDFVIDNTAGANNITLALGTGITSLSLSWSPTVTASSTTGVGIFRLVFTSATTAVITRIG